MRPPPQQEPQSANKQDISADDKLSPYENALRAHFPSREEILQEAKTQRKRRRRIKSATGTALSILLVSIWLIDPVLQSRQFTTTIGQQSAYTLLDGSVITLNTQTAVQAEIRLRSQHLTLIQGEASFHVNHSWRPFMVYANHATIRDIGTIFNVRHTREGAMVTVIEGAVEVCTPTTKQILIQNQTTTARGHSIAPIQSIAATTAAAWLQGKLIFDGTPLQEAIAEIQRYRQAPLIIQDEKAARLRVSGEYDIQGIESLIDTLPISIAVRIRRTPDNTVIIESR